MPGFIVIARVLPLSHQIQKHVILLVVVSD
jgi:hypothetical protein